MSIFGLFWSAHRGCAIFLLLEHHGLVLLLQELLLLQHEVLVLGQHLLLKFDALSCKALLSLLLLFK